MWVWFSETFLGPPGDSSAHPKGEWAAIGHMALTGPLLAGLGG